MEREHAILPQKNDFAKISIISIDELNDTTCTENIEILINTGSRDCDALLKAFLLFQGKRTQDPMLQLGKISMRMFGKTPYAEKKFYHAVNYLKSYMRLFATPTEGKA